MTSQDNIHNLTQIANCNIPLSPSEASLFRYDDDDYISTSTSRTTEPDKLLIENNKPPSPITSDTDRPAPSSIAEYHPQEEHQQERRGSISLDTLTSLFIENGTTLPQSEFPQSESETEDQEHNGTAPPQRHHLSFGDATNTVSDSIVEHMSAKSKRTVMAMAVTDDSEDEAYDTYDSDAKPSSRDMGKKKKSWRATPGGVLKKNPKPVSDRKLSNISKVYDLDGDGILDAIEQAMRNADKDGDGQLDMDEVHRIVQDQLKAKNDVTLYKKVAGALLCLVVILSISNFGTSWATAILSKEIAADSETGTLQSSNGDIMGFQQTAFEFELGDLSDEEFDERRKLVDDEMMEDPDHEDHLHRRLGKNKNKKNKCGCAKIDYDRGKIKEKDLLDLTYKCDGVNTVTIKRKFKRRGDVMEGYSEDVDVDTICGPGTTVKKRGKKKRNKNGNKVKVVDDRITFTQKNGRSRQRDSEVHFDCVRGDCFATGTTLLQRAGHSCNLRRDSNGGGDCHEGLVCYDRNDDGRTGECVQLQRFARRNQVCQVDHGVDACDANLVCQGNDNFSRTLEGVVETGICMNARIRDNTVNIVVIERDDDFCDANYGSNACPRNHICVGENGRELEFGVGYCIKLVQFQRNGGACNLSDGNNACTGNNYCRDDRFPRAGDGGNFGRSGQGAGSNQGAIISGPSGTVGGGNAGSISADGMRSPRTSGMGICTPYTRRGGTCGWNGECEDGGRCNGLGADTATGGVIRGSSGTIVWGTGASTTGTCG